MNLHAIKPKYEFTEDQLYLFYQWRYYYKGDHRLRYHPNTGQLEYEMIGYRTGEWADFSRASQRSWVSDGKVNWNRHYGTAIRADLIEHALPEIVS